ncbi:MAG: FAD binding domain-containing protein [Pseudomonadota bacterium]
MSDQFQYPISVADAVRLLKSSEGARAIAGGQSLVLEMRRVPTPHGPLIAIDSLRELTGITASEKQLRIGAAETHQSIAGSQIVKTELPALSLLAESIGDPQIRNRGTVAGAIVSNAHHTDYAAALVALEGVIHTTHRSIPTAEIWQCQEALCLASDELVTSISFEIPMSAEYVRRAHTAAGYAELAVFTALHSADLIRVGMIGDGFSPATTTCSTTTDLDSCFARLADIAQLTVFQRAQLKALQMETECRLQDGIN